MLDPTTSPAGVFLSYAREDSDAARRIADALRAFGVEVWFDQNELRGGDAWDAKIRRQIRECVLFVPIISHHTQERDEGYFRREWKLAVERTHDMASGVPFLLPVVIDDTVEADAVVPDELMRVQWSRLPRGVPTPQFVEQVKRLAENPRRFAGDHGRSRAPSAPARRGVPAWSWGSGVAVVVAIATALWVSRRPDVPPSPPAKPAASPAGIPAAAAKPAPVSDKSIAVLPFSNMSEEKDSAFFADGIHEDILTNLALIGQLRVVSRTSVMQYRETKKPIGQIAAELGVNYILEGSVRRVGNKVRVTGQLIHAATDEHVWAKAYDRDLTDMFTIQAELSQQIAAALKAALSPEEKERLNRRPTDNPLAYDLYLQARDLQNRFGNSAELREQRTKLLLKAVELDPKFAQAFGELADVYANEAFLFSSGVDDFLAKAKAAMDRAIQLAPDDPEVIGSYGTYFYYGFRDYQRAAEQYERLARMQPNNPVFFGVLSLIQRRQGNYAQSLASTRRAMELDPGNISYLRNAVATLEAGNRFEEARVLREKIVAMLPQSLDEAYQLGLLSFLATGSTREVDAYFARLSERDLASPLVIDQRRDWASTKGDYAESIRLDRIQPFYQNSYFSETEQMVISAIDYFVSGDTSGAVARLRDTPRRLQLQLEREPRNARAWMFRAAAEAIMGHPDEALRCADRSVQLLPVTLDHVDGPNLARVRATVLAFVGRKDEAIAEFQRLARQPFALNIHTLKSQVPMLRDDPRFQALIADPRNNAPLF